MTSLLPKSGGNIGRCDDDWLETVHKALPSRALLEGAFVLRSSWVFGVSGVAVSLARVGQQRPGPFLFPGGRSRFPTFMFIGWHPRLERMRVPVYRGVLSSHRSQPSAHPRRGHKSHTHPYDDPSLHFARPRQIWWQPSLAAAFHSAAPARRRLGHAA
jgi:hypothetical protein